MKKTIALIDCDSFFVSCEQILNPTLKNKPVCVVTGERNGCIIARSKEAKEMGIQMGIPYFKAHTLFKEIIFVSAKHEQYRIISKKVMECIKNFSPVVEVVSIDEAYIDLTGLNKIYQKEVESIALDIRETIQKKTGISVSIGLSSSKILAKLASDKAKNTGGLFTIYPNNILKVLETTLIDDISGIGRHHQKKLHYHGIYKASELVQKNNSWIRHYLGIHGVELKYELLGEYISAIDNTNKKPQSIQRTRALSSFTSDIEKIKGALCLHIHEACRELRENNAYTEAIRVILKTKDFHFYEEKVKLKTPTNNECEIIPLALKTLSNICRPRLLYRSTGISFEHLCYKDSSQLSLFNENKIKENQLGQALDMLEKKYGKNIVKTGYI